MNKGYGSIELKVVLYDPFLTQLIEAVYAKQIHVQQLVTNGRFCAPIYVNFTVVLHDIKSLLGLNCLLLCVKGTVP